MAISSVPWFATTVEGSFGVGTGGIFATIVRVVQAFVCVWVIVLAKIKFILTEQTGSQYSHQYTVIVIKSNKWSIINAAFWLVELLPGYML